MNNSVSRLAVVVRSPSFRVKPEKCDCMIGGVFYREKSNIF